MSVVLIINNCWDCPYRENNKGGKVPHYCRKKHTRMCDEDFPKYCPLPPGIPQVKTGHWIMHDRYRECSVCRVWFPKDIPRNSFCPNCGKKMESEVEK